MAITRAHSNRTRLVDGHEGLLIETKVTMHLPQTRQEKEVLSAPCDARGRVGVGRDVTHFKHGIFNKLL